MMRAVIAIVCAATALALSAAGVQAQDVALTRAATPYDALIEEANEAYAADAFAEAVVLLRQAAERDPARPEAYNNLGVAHLDLGEYELAADWFAELAEAVRAMPADDATAAVHYVQAHDGMLEAGGLLLDEGAAAEALVVFEALLRLFPESGDARHNLALAQAELGRWDDMAATARSMIEHEPLSNGAWSLLQDAWIGQADHALDDADYDAANQRFDDVHAQAEGLPVRIDGIFADPETGTLTGLVTGFAAEAGAPVRIRVRFFGRGGVVDERVVPFTSPGTGEQRTFTASGPSVPVTGWTYTLEE